MKKLLARLGICAVGLMAGWGVSSVIRRIPDIVIAKAISVMLGLLVLAGSLALLWKVSEVVWNWWTDYE